MSTEHPIHEQEWLRIATTIPTLHRSVEDYYSRRNKAGETERFYPWRVTDLPGSPYIWYMDGALHMNSPGPAEMIWMYSLALALAASVIGEDGCRYGPDGKIAQK